MPCESHRFAMHLIDNRTRVAEVPNRKRNLSIGDPTAVPDAWDFR